RHEGRGLDWLPGTIRGKAVPRDVLDAVRRLLSPAPVWPARRALPGRTRFTDLRSYPLSISGRRCESLFACPRSRQLSRLSSTFLDRLVNSDLLFSNQLSELREFRAALAAADRLPFSLFVAREIHVQDFRY